MIKNLLWNSSFFLIELDGSQSVEVGPGSSLALRYTIDESCELHWKFKTQIGDISFGVQKKKAMQKLLLREEVSNFHIELVSSFDPEETNLFSGPGMPDIQIHNDEQNDDSEIEYKTADSNNSITVNL